ncbi:hypothetical protein FOA52_000671 [Chlamydomonas sp. UWO 241]|nr:hypothetical protein FOA52_000671 [Chlamydomonas sp. UWO 241]
MLVNNPCSIACSRRAPRLCCKPITAITAPSYRAWGHSLSLRRNGKCCVLVNDACAPASAASLCDEEGRCLPEENGVLVCDDLDVLLKALPEDIRSPLIHHPSRNELLEVVLDLGRRPEARFLGKPGGDFLREAPVMADDLIAAEAAVGLFGHDNRAGITGTLHRISAIRNRRGAVIGLTCRVGRAVSGHADMIRDIVESNQSVLLLGRPGVGKTTVVREIARLLSVEMRRRVVIVDTSNEIGGDGDVPHPAIGSARRMQVPDPSRQHHVMIEAVENHTPEVIIVDEIGSESEALACRTIAERGITLIGTAHGRVLENLMQNPTLCDLVGGIESVTLGDETAKTRGTKKTVLERKAPPTFPIVVEIRERGFYVAHWTQDSVDTLLQGNVPNVRQRDGDGVRVSTIKYDQVSEPSEAPPLGASAYDADYDAALAMAAQRRDVVARAGVTDGAGAGVAPAARGLPGSGVGSAAVGGAAQRGDGARADGAPSASDAGAAAPAAGLPRLPCAADAAHKERAAPPPLPPAPRANNALPFGAALVRSGVGSGAMAGAAVRRTGGALPESRSLVGAFLAKQETEREFETSLDADGPESGGGGSLAAGAARGADWAPGTGFGPSAFVKPHVSVMTGGAGGGKGGKRGKGRASARRAD